jgi:sugar phosphate isomerase/epimerase
MDRRTFLHAGVMATLAARVLDDKALARAQASTGQAGAPAPAANPTRLIMDAYSRHLHWLRSPDEVAEAAIAMTCGGLMPTVQPHPGHIDPADVERQLPAFVRVIQKHGLRVKQIRGGNQTDVDAQVERLVGTMAQVGATHYWLGTDNYNLSQPILPQLDAIKAKVERFVALNRKHGTTLMYHTRAGANSVGSVVWDLLYVMKDFDPRHVGFHWDTGHMSHHGAMWETLLRTAGPYVSAIGWKDRSWQRSTDAGAAVGRAGGQAGDAAAGRGGAEGRGGAGGRGRGRGAATPANAWTSPYVPMGTGLVDVARYAVVLKDIGFSGPMELQAEYPNGGADAGADTLTRPRAEVLDMMTRDVQTIRTGFERSGAGLMI